MHHSTDTGSPKAARATASRAIEHSQPDAPHIRLPRLELVAMYACAALVTFGIIFTISAAVMTAPRDVRLADDHPNLKAPSARKSPATVENAALKQSVSVR